MVRTEERTEKLASRRSAAAKIAPAIEGAVVSNPTPRKTISFPGFFAAISTASRGE
jgi:hypothetical protein